MSHDPNSAPEIRAEDSPGEVPEITAAALRQRLAENRPVHVIDIRPEEEFGEWRIPTSRSWPVYGAIRRGEEPDPDDLPDEDSGPVVTVCGSGKKSRAAAKILHDHGREAYSLHGGLRGWTFAWNRARVPTAGAATVVQLRRTGKGCLSYLIGHGDEAVVIDRSLAPSAYRSVAEERDWSIRAQAALFTQPTPDQQRSVRSANDDRR
jgi:rhodanese-related sulfurtransferase